MPLQVRLEVHKSEIKVTTAWDLLKEGSLTLQAQSSLQGTFDVWTDFKVFWTKADEVEVGMMRVYGVDYFWKFRKKKFYS